MKIDYDKQNHLWQIWTTEGPERLITKVKKVVMKVPSMLLEFEHQKHGYLVVNGVLTINDDQVATITKEKTA